MPWNSPFYNGPFVDDDGIQGCVFCGEPDCYGECEDDEIDLFDSYLDGEDEDDEEEIVDDFGYDYEDELYDDDIFCGNQNCEFCN